VGVCEREEKGREASEFVLFCSLFSIFGHCGVFSVISLLRLFRFAFAHVVHRETDCEVLEKGRPRKDPPGKKGRESHVL
jgi:hypothetical protein